MEPRVIGLEDTELIIAQDVKYGYAGEVWDAALVLSHFILDKKKKHNFNFEDKIILELGSGTGICGLCLSLKKAKKVYITDKEIALININYKANFGLCTKNTEIIVQTLDWSIKDHYENFSDQLDYIIASDIIWNRIHFDSIIATMDKLASKSTQILIAYQCRQGEDMEFFDKMKSSNQWIVENIPASFLDDEYTADDICLIRVLKYREFN